MDARSIAMRMAERQHWRKGARGCGPTPMLEAVYDGTDPSCHATTSLLIATCHAVVDND